MKILGTKSIAAYLLDVGQIVVDESGTHFDKVTSLTKIDLDWIEIKAGEFSFHKKTHDMVSILAMVDFKISVDTKISGA